MTRSRSSGSTSRRPSPRRPSSSSPTPASPTACWPTALGDLNGADPLPNFQGLPLQVFVDDDGEVAYMAYEAFESVEEIEEMVGEHLGVDL